MKVLILSSFIFMTSFFARAQETPLDCMQGIWMVYYDDPSQKGFSVQKEYRVLSVGYTEDIANYTPSVRELFIGFLDYDPNDTGRVDYLDLKPKGPYYIELYADEMSQDSVFTSKHFLTPDYEGCDSEGLYIQARQMMEYGRLEILPSKVSVLYDLTSLYVGVKAGGETIETFTLSGSAMKNIIQGYAAGAEFVNVTYGGVTLTVQLKKRAE
ncbi:hypothetical protein SAMN04488028_1144 [Reichenbachiella agariperforans]|uniref:Lipocalin-like domain-containing protein n=1 Tax=Reichenbachiella agariperforans TaxID=156994 RepID=A0A1M6WNI2_REIAG|nr:hypothetical protein [Reichenbachiella agariperforans]SHK95322.1 hypothetical protein SAMN04488028_1144 [Reichenbachiella agariperforans]